MYPKEDIKANYWLADRRDQNFIEIRGIEVKNEQQY